MGWELQVWAKYPFVFLSGLLVTLALTPVWRWAARPLGFIDAPEARRLHATPTATAGGLALFAGFHVACAAIFLLPWKPFAGQVTQEWWLRYLAVSSGVVAIGVMDDRFALRARTKLMGQVLVALLAYAVGIRMEQLASLGLPEWVDLVGTVVWFLVFMNAFNLIDGMDGLAAGLAVVAAMGVAASLLFRHEPGDVLMLLGLAGACIGFLRYNFHPASVFLGDTGSMFLGCTLAAVALGTSSKATTMASLGVPILAAGVPVLDAGLAIWRRSARAFLSEGARTTAWPLAVADKEHLHHRLIRRGFSQRRVAVVLYGLGIVLSAVGVLMAAYRQYALGLMLLAFLLGAYVLIRHLAWIELWDSGAAVLQGVSRPNWQSRALYVYPLIDVGVMASCLALALALVSGMPGLKHAWVTLAPQAIGIPFALLVLSRAYSRVWSLARVSEHALTGLTVAAGILLELGLRLFVAPAMVRQQVLTSLVYLGMSVPLIVGARGFVRIVQDAMGWMSRFAADRVPARRVLLVGAGPWTTLFLKERSILNDPAARMVVVGLLDDDPGLRGRWVHGYRVIGNTECLPTVLDGGHVDVVVIVSQLEAVQVERIIALAQPYRVTVLQWVTHLRTLAAPA